jgi:predicted CoA-substrate-specific enzyme activase
MNIFLGIDVGSVSTKMAAIDENEELVSSCYLPTQGKPIEQICRLMHVLESELPLNARIIGVGATGSARYLAGELTGADLVKNEITSQAIAALHFCPDVRTVFEIGGQDSKLIVLRDGIVTDFAMNTVCAAGTGSFLDHQALRLGINIDEFGKIALTSTNPVRIAGRCTVFAESDMIHQQQVGHSIPDILYGLCQALVRNYLSNVGLSKDIQSPILFQGGVAFNKAIIKAFEEELKTELIVPPHKEIMGAMGIALLARQEMQEKQGETRFKGFKISELEYKTSSFSCSGCPNQCEIVQLKAKGETVARWGGRCERWQIKPVNEPDKKTSKVTSRV